MLVLTEQALLLQTGCLFTHAGPEITQALESTVEAYPIPELTALLVDLY